MAPFENDGQTFRVVNDLDLVFYPFWQTMNLFDYAFENRNRIRNLMASAEFQDAVKGLDFKPNFSLFKPTTQTIELFPPKETIRLYERLKKKRLGIKRRELLWQKFVDHVFVEWRANTNWICTLTHRRSVWDFLKIARSKNTNSQSQRATLVLLELDPLFFFASEVIKTVKNASISREKEFFSDLSHALDPNYKTKAFEKRRREFALRALSAHGFENKSYAKWAEFFEYYDRQIEMVPNIRLDQVGFVPYEDRNSVRQAIKEYDIPKLPARRGRPLH